MVLLNVAPEKTISRLCFIRQLLNTAFRPLPFFLSFSVLIVSLSSVLVLSDTIRNYGLSSSPSTVLSSSWSISSAAVDQYFHYTNTVHS